MSSGCTHSATVPWVTSIAGVCSMKPNASSPLNSSAPPGVPSGPARTGVSVCSSAWFSYSR